MALFTCKNELVAIAELLCDTASIKAMSEGEIANNLCDYESRYLSKNVD